MSLFELAQLSTLNLYMLDLTYKCGPDVMALAVGKAVIALRERPFATRRTMSTLDFASPGEVCKTKHND